MTKIPHVKVGDQISADDFNAVAQRLMRFRNLRVAPGSGLILTSGPYGHALTTAIPHPIWGKLSGSSSPYTWVEVAASASGAWTTFGKRGGNKAYEVNNKSGLNNKVVQLWWTEAGDMRFAYEGVSSTCPPGAAQICATILDDGCGTPLGTGATITVKDGGGSTIGTCTTTGTVTALSLIGGGAGYTNGTGYALAFSGGGGSGAAGTFDVVGGICGNLQLTSGGSGYTSAPSVSFAAAGGGSGAGATATTQERCCIPISSSGTYTVTSDVPGTTTKTTTINATCTLGNNVNFTYASNTMGKFCVNILHCTGASPSPAYAGVSVSITGAGTVSGTTDSSGNYCVKLGVGNYTVSLASPGGATYSTPFSITACSTTNLSTAAYSALCLSVRVADTPCGCSASVTVKNDDTGTTLGTGTVSVTWDGVTCSGSACISISEIFSGTFNNFDVDFVFPHQTANTTTSAGCYNTSSPYSVTIGGITC